jgi:ABC-2 type transport system permease protein
MALGLPVVMLILFGYALTLDVDRIPLLIYDQSETVHSRELVSRFVGSRYFQVLGRARSHRAIETGILRGTVLAGLVIPLDFAKQMERGEEAKIQLLIDGSDSNTASIALGYANAIILAENLSLISGSTKGVLPGIVTVENRLRLLYNHEQESKNYIVPGLVAVILMIIAALLTSLTLAKEWETGTMEQLLSTPVRSSELVLGKMAAYFILGVMDTLIAIALGIVVFEVPMRGSHLLLGLSCMIFLIGALFWGILLSATTRNQLLAYQAGVLTSFLPAFLLSGFMFAIENMPEGVQFVTYAVPARYMITLLRGIFLKGVGLEVLLWEFLLLTLFALVVFLFATKKLKREIV